MPTMTVTASEARANFSQIANHVSENGTTITVFKNSKPWVQIVPSDFALETNNSQRVKTSKNPQNVLVAENSRINQNSQNAEYIDIVASALRESKQQIKQGKSYKGVNTLIDKLAQENPEVWK